jgi:hypothetical protein
MRPNTHWRTEFTNYFIENRRRLHHPTFSVVFPSLRAARSFFTAFRDALRFASYIAHAMSDLQSAKKNRRVDLVSTSEHFTLEKAGIDRKLSARAHFIIRSLGSSV